MHHLMTVPRFGIDTEKGSLRISFAGISCIGMNLSGKLKTAVGRL